MSRSAREVDLDPRTFVGLSFPLRADDTSNFAMTRNSVRQASHNLRNLLLTYPGERPGNPGFGCKLREIIFEQHDDQLSSKIEDTISKSIQAQLPYINIINIETLTEKTDSNKVFVSIEFSTTLDPSVNQTLTLNITNGTEEY